MRLLVTIVILMMTFHTQMWSQETWVRTYGGSRGDSGNSIITTPDGGYVLTGSTESNDGDFKGMNKGREDVFVIKLDSHGHVQWRKTLGGSRSDAGCLIAVTEDRGYVITGLTSSKLDMNWKTDTSDDVFIVRMDSLGNNLWKTLVGGSDDEIVDHLSVLQDNAVFIAGRSNSKFRIVYPPIGQELDAFVVRISSDGTVLWHKVLTEDPRSEDSSSTAERPVFLVGQTWMTEESRTFGGGGTPLDVSVSMIDTKSIIQWNRVFGGRSLNMANAVSPTEDGGCVVTGFTNGRSGYFHGMVKGSLDIFVVRLDARGNFLWRNTYGGSEIDEANSIKVTADGGYVLTGSTISNDGDFEGMNKGNHDIFVIKLDSRGDVLWKRVFGGSEWDEGVSITTTPDGGYVLTGKTYSKNGDFDGMNQGDDDIFVIKLDSNGNLQRNSK